MCFEMRLDIGFVDTANGGYKIVKPGPVDNGVWLGVFILGLIWTVPTAGSCGCGDRPPVSSCRHAAGLFLFPDFLMVLLPSFSKIGLCLIKSSGFLSSLGEVTHQLNYG